MTCQPFVLLLLSSLLSPAVLAQGACDELLPIEGPGLETVWAYQLSNDGRVVLGNFGSSTTSASAALWDEVNGFRPLSPLVGINVVANALSGNGLVATVWGGGSLYRWSEQFGLQVIAGASFSPRAIDEDGDVIVGLDYSTLPANRSLMWTPAGGFQAIGGQGVRAGSVSGDGLVVVGERVAATGQPPRAFRWTAAQGFQDLGVLNPGGMSSRATAVNHDGTVVVGVSRSGGGSAFEFPFIWTEVDGIQPLSVPPAATAGYAHAVSSDGRFVVGRYTWIRPGSNVYEDVAVRWSLSGGMHEVPVPPRPVSVAAADSRAVDVSDDGRTVLASFSYVATHQALLSRMTSLGAPYCENTPPNSTGCRSILEVLGNAVVSDNNVTLATRRLPANVFGFFLTSRDTAATPLANSQGILCLGGFIGRFVGPGQILNSGLDGRFSLWVDLDAMPVPFGANSVQPGETWNFQAWHRDVDGSGAPTSNLTDAVAVTFR